MRARLGCVGQLWLRAKFEVELNLHRHYALLHFTDDLGSQSTTMPLCMFALAALRRCLRARLCWCLGYIWRHQEETGQACCLTKGEPPAMPNQKLWTTAQDSDIYQPLSQPRILCSPMEIAEYFCSESELTMGTRNSLVSPFRHTHHQPPSHR